MEPAQRTTSSPQQPKKDVTDQSAHNRHCQAIKQQMAEKPIVVFVAGGTGDTKRA
jgi:hypothetical protein